ncbi:MAG: hypothetical protein IJ315_09860 [Firmicutes bacterium]|nr:hypothetical protein [Bacillota bacterium]
MIFTQKWTGRRVGYEESFPVTVPGDIQADYAQFMGWGDVNYGDSWAKFRQLEDDTWVYSTRVQCEANENERVYFVTKGIEYEYDVCMNGKVLLHHEGMFTPVDVDITEALSYGDLLEVIIYPHPKREGAAECRDQADQCCKPAVGYEWDWHPRLLVSGLWDETYIETRKESFIRDAEVFYTLDEDLKGAEVRFEIDCDGECEVELYGPDGLLVYRGPERVIRLENVKLWWCNGQGHQNLYQWAVYSDSKMRRGRIGFRRVRLVMNDGAWDEPSVFPKGRSNPPITIELNGRRIFAKGSNWVTPEIFTGQIDWGTYEKQLDLARRANMNILRCWGGAIINKESFFDLCDEYGLMVWQEFPLACNNYVGTPHYLAVLEQEARAIIKRVRQHACHVLWCGGNELFNDWSMMTDQSHALRLLNKLCYEMDFDKPFIPTSPIMGMAHGHYHFHEVDTGRYSFEIFNGSSNTAYTEFGVPAIVDVEQLKLAIPEADLHDPKPGGVWQSHMAFGAWGEESWFCKGILDDIFGPQETLEDYIEKSNWTQCVGYKHIFEEARRQWPHCSMAINWCYNEPWINAAGNMLLEYPAKPRPAYYAVQSSLRPVLPSARMETFAYDGGSVFSAELWLLNDAPVEVSDTIHVYIIIDGVKEHVMDWKTGVVPAQTNKRGHKIQIQLPAEAVTQKLILRLESDRYDVSEYELLLRGKKKVDEPEVKILNM